MRLQKSIGLLALAVAVVWCRPVAWGETNVWPHVRGPRYDGHADDAGLPWPWPSGQPPVLWRKQVGEGYSGLIVVGQRLYSQVQTLSGQYVVCLDLLTGRELWRTRSNYPWQPDGDWPGPYASPTYGGGKIYFADCFGIAGCLDALTGRTLWAVDLAKRFAAEIPAFGYACTPLLHDGKVYLPLGGKDSAVVALQADTGRLAWQSGDGTASYSSCVLLPVEGRDHVVVFLDQVALGLDPATGREFWRYAWSDGYEPHGVWPFYQEPYLFYGLPFRHGSHALKLRRTAEGVRAEPAWTNNIMSLDILSGVVVNEFIYGFDVNSFQTKPKGGTAGAFKCVELATGRERWTNEAPGHASVVAWGDKLVILNESGFLIVAEANPAAYRELARWAVFPRRRCWTPPTLCGPFLVARSRDEFLCAFLGDPARLPADVARAAKISPGLRDRVSEWLSRQSYRSFHEPTWAVKTSWYFSSLLAVLLPAGLLALTVRPPYRRAAFLLAGLALAISATWFLTHALGFLVFTWPVAPYLVLTFLFGCRAWVLEAPGARRLLAARLALLGFGLAIAGYWLLCRSLFLIAGYGFLFGLLPAAPLLLWAFSDPKEEKPNVWFLFKNFAAFSVYFWSSAWVIWWRIDR